MDAYQLAAIRRGVEVMKQAQDGSGGACVETFHAIARLEGFDGLVQTAYGLANVCSYLLMTRQCEERVSATETLETLGTMAANARR